MTLPRWLYTLVLMLCLSIGLAACDKLQEFTGPSPEQVLTSYFDAIRSGRWNDAYALVSAKDRAVKSLDAYKAEFSGENAMFASLLGQISYKILAVEREGDRAKAKVEASAPDFGGVAVELLQNMVAAALSTRPAEDPRKTLERGLKDNKGPVRTQQEQYVLVREADGWRVFLDWSTKQQVASLLAEARQLRQKNQLAAARDKYDAILKLDSSAESARKESETLRKDLAAFEAKQAYFGKIELYDLSAKYRDSLLQPHLPSVTFKLRNTGDRSLRKVEVTVYFEDANGAVIGEETFLPVNVSLYSFNDSKPLRPNYIWQIESGRFFAAKSIPTEWKEGAVKAKITNIEFGEGAE